MSNERIDRYIEGELSAEDWIGVVPALPEWPSTIDWHALGVDEALAIINFTNSVCMSRSAALLEHTHYVPDARAKVGLYSAQLILEAMALVEQLRLSWRLSGWRSLAFADIKAHVEELAVAFELERATIKRRTESS